jgi:quercetin dioxygenase-like cupin family protein
MRRNKLAWCAVALGLLGPELVSAQVTQSPPQPPESRVRFQGATRFRGPPEPDSVRVDIRLWSVGGGQRIARLELPFDGLLVVELRGGRLTTLIGGRRVARREGEIWTVPAGAVMGIETQSDMATFQTTLVAGP